MQPPPRKGNYAKFLKNLHSEQIAKLQLKNQHECDLLEDIRTFTIKRSAIEKSYSDALLKISLAYLNKKIPNIPDIKLDGGEERWNMWNVWRTVLEENEKLAKARLAAVEVFQQQIADEAKVLRTHKIQTCKKFVDSLAQVQKELQTCVQDVDKTKKLYFDEEHSAHDVRDKAKDLEEKLKKKKGSFFQSITSLQKNSARVSTKREQLEEKSTGARNDYLLGLAAANAHQSRYFAVDLQSCTIAMEAGVYERVAEFLTLMGRTELLTCSATQHSYTKIRDQAQRLTRDYNVLCCNLYYPVLKQHIQYDFEACDNDPVDKVTTDHDSAMATLGREARRYATRIARENNAIRENLRRLQVMAALRESGQRVDPTDPNGPDLETKMDELRVAIRRSETAKVKAEARIECLRAGGVNVDEWMQEAETLSVHDIARSASSLSVHTDASGVGDQPSSDSFYDSDFNDAEPVTPASTDRPSKAASAAAPTMQIDSDDEMESAEVDAMLEQERQRIEQLTAGWDDPTQVDWGSEEPSAEPSANQQPSGPVLKCTALYSYTAQNPDELSIVENEQLEVVGEGDGDGWLRARNYRGEEGFVPHNYLDVERDVPSSGSGGAGSAGGLGPLQTQFSFSSVDYTVEAGDSGDAGDGPDAEPASEQNQSPEQVSVISLPHQQEASGFPDGGDGLQESLPTAQYCIALYDYEGDEEQELTFEEGQVIRIVNKCAHGVDDGWWEGELEGRIGNFPSLVVEECDENGEPITGQWDDTPPASAPPVFTPPDVPEFAFGEIGLREMEGDADREEGTRPAEDAVAAVVPDAPHSFAMHMSGRKHNQYDQQFQSQNGHPEDPDCAGIPCVIVEDEEGTPVTDGDAEDGEFGLGVAQIVITAATPMREEPEQPFPPPDGEEDESAGQDREEQEPPGANSHEEEPLDAEEEDATKEPEVNGEEADERSAADDAPTDSAPFPVSSSSEGETTGPSTAENSQSGAVVTGAPGDDAGAGGDPGATATPKQVVGGRASIPDELEPHQLARLQDLKESNA